MEKWAEAASEMIELRDYQREAIDALYGWFQKARDGNPLLVLPTGSGKSLIAARICEDALRWPNQRVLILTHVRELVEQNHAQLFRLWPSAPSGIYCVGLDRKQFHHPITIASIQSVYKKAQQINWRDLIIIDEAHLLGDNDSSMYRSFLDQMKNINPDVRVIGLSATPYRLKSGYLHKGDKALFSDIAFDLPITRLVKEGYLSPLVSKAAVTQGNTDKLAIQAGEFAMREAITEFDREEMTKAAVEEMLSFGQDRKSWLIFCVSIEHAKHVRDALREHHIDVEMVCESTPAGERKKILDDLKAGRIRAVTNVSVLTTGFDAPNIDMIVLLRPTMSPGLLVQMCGRGMRLAPNKQNCLVLDMAGNLERHGPITHIQPKDGKRKDKKERDGKMCPKCRTICSVYVMECSDCGYIFEGVPRTIKHSMKAAQNDVMSEEPPMGADPNWFTVKKITYMIHQKPGSYDSLRVSYNCSPNHVSEWVCFGHPPSSIARKKAEKWWMARRGNYPIPDNAVAAFSRLNEIAGVKSQRIKAVKKDKYAELQAYDLVDARTRMIKHGGNLGLSIVQEDVTDEQTISA